MGEMQNEWTIENGRVTRRTVLLGALGAVGATAFLAACGSDGDSSDATTGGTTPAAGTDAAGTTPAAGTDAPAAGDVGSTLAAMLGIDAATAGKGESIDLGAVLALTGSGSFYGKTMSRGLDLAKAHIEAAGGPTFNYIYLDHKSGDAPAGVAAMTELVSKKVPAKFASYVDDLGAMLAATAEAKMFTLDGGGGTSIFGQAQPYFWGTRAITPDDPMPGLFQYLKTTYPDAKTVGFVGWDLGEPNNTTVKTDILKKIADGGYDFNNLYELVPVGGQDFSQVLPKIKSNEPDILLVSNYGQDPGSFANQAATAGLKAIQIGFEFTPDGVSASKGTYDSAGYTFAYDYFDASNPISPFAKLFVEEFKAAYGGDEPDFYAANFYENAFVMWEVMRRVIKSGGDIHDGDALDKGLRENLTVVSVYGGDDTTVGTYTLDETTHSVTKRDMGVFEYKDGKVTPKAFFGIGGSDFKMA
ncbi:MAG: transporter substrate-binding protein [Ilumatobacteraceae bacterium]|nr:transporter substrate-binding protein [Ilumatobacteraceae bacterium]